MSVGSNPPRVLVVDDEERIRGFAERVLREGGYDVVTAPDGPEALRLVGEQGRFDGFVIDVMMPQMRGDELARALRRIEPDAKVLYFTGYSDNLFKEKVTLWEHEAFLDKPVTVDGLLQAVSLLLFGHTRGPQ
jgi:two-component system cell cycle sensor histidine kinase/response regulator CckA